MAQHFLIFDTVAEADVHIDVLDNSVAFTYGGRPSLPRCDSYKWSDSEVQRGAKCVAECPCIDRASPDPACPYITTTSSEVVNIGASGFAVKVIAAHAAASIDTTDARQLTEDEILFGR